VSRTKISRALLLKYAAEVSDLEEEGALPRIVLNVMKDLEKLVAWRDIPCGCDADRSAR
jgi:hypothetical protein